MRGRAGFLRQHPTPAHSLPTSHGDQPRLLCAPEEGARTEGESVWGAGSSAEAISPAFLPAGGGSCAQLLAEGSQKGLPWEQDQASAFAFSVHLMGVWSLCWYLAFTTTYSEESCG